MALPPKICPSCGEEYLHTVARCAECDVELGSEPPPARPAPELPGAEQLVPVRRADPTWVAGLAEALARAGIPSRVELARPESERARGRRGERPPCTLYVRPDDLEHAARIDAEFARMQLPDLPAEAAPAGEGDACPACGEALAPDAIECPSCGLAFAVEE
jgi:hypothetical protein